MRVWLLCLFGLVCVWSAGAAAHDGRPVLVHVSGPETARVLEWQAPPVIPAGAEPRLVLEGCAVRVPTQHGLIGRGLYDCTGASHMQVRLIWPHLNPALSSLVQTESGARLYGPEHQLIPLDTLARHGTDFAAFVESGVVHILLGSDHLLFILAMTLIVVLRGTGTRRQIAGRLGWLVTGFTLAHSLTLALATLNILTLPVAPVEAAIALSILFVCVELARPVRDSLTWRFPALTASAFGLLHGLGFARVLSDAGLEAGHRLTGLLGFNLGVEIGQLGFVALICAVLAVARTLASPAARGQMVMALVYAMGGVSSFWVFDRLLAF